MSERNRLPHAPFGVGLAVALLFVGAALLNHYNGNAEDRYPGTGQKYQSNQQAILGANVGIGALDGYAYCPSGDIPRCDLAAQQSMTESTREMANASWVGTILTLVGVVLLLLTLVATRGLLHEAAKTTRAAEQTVIESEKATQATLTAALAAVEGNKLNRDHFVASGRAWVDIVEVRWPKLINVSETSAAVRVSATILNYGNTPATGVAFGFKLVAIGGDFSPESMLEGIRAKQLTVQGDKIAFPGTPLPSASHGILLNRDDIAAARAKLKRPDTPITVYLIVNVIYSAFGDAQRRETGLAGRLVSKSLNLLVPGEYEVAFIRSDRPFLPWVT